MSARSCRWAIVLLALTAAGCANRGPLFVAKAPHMPGPGPAPTAAGETTDDDAPPPADFTVAEHERITLVQPWVKQAAQEHELEEDLINGVIWVESRFQPRAKSPAGARGLMQLMPPTAAALARAMGKTRASSYDPEFNVMAGSMYLRKMLNRYDGDLRLALAAYNAGAGNVDKWMKKDGLPPFSEEYVTLVMNAKRRFEAVHRPQLDTDTMIAKMETKPPVQPLDVVPDPPVRYDLDKVESDYVPQHDPEPPIADVPDPDLAERKAAEAKAPDAKPEKPSAPTETKSPAPKKPEPVAPPFGTGKLPSVLD